MSPEARRILIPLIVGGLALMLVLLAVFSPRRQPAPDPEGDRAVEVEPEAHEDAAPPEPDRPEPDEPAPAPDADEMPAEPEHHEDEPATDPDAVRAPEADDETDPDAPLTIHGLHATASPEGEVDPDVEPASIGSLDPSESRMLVEFARLGAGIQRITLSDQWITAAAKRQAERHYAAIEAGDPDPPPLPDDALRYVLKEAQPLGDWMIPVLSSHRLSINGEPVWLFDYARDSAGDRLVDEDGEYLPVWSEIAPGKFETIIRNEDGRAVVRVERHFIFGPNDDITLNQRIENLTDQSLDVQWRQFGPSDLVVDRSRYLDRRRFRFGYLRSPEVDPERLYVTADDNALVLERREVFNRYDPQRNFTLWPNDRSERQGYELSWFAVTNRYFALVVHPVLDDHGRGSRSLADVVERIIYRPSTTHDPHTAVIFSYLDSPGRTLEAGETTSLNMGVYAGPMDRNLLRNLEPYRSLSMDQLILYQMSTWCAICTFQWLAKFLMVFLGFLHDYVLFDWGLAIIGLVIVVRLLLHPITKKSQINMMRFGKQMQALKPEIDKLQKKYKDDPKRMQQEQLQLFREHGVNPFQMLGCLPMFLQIPIWIALYAMLYFAFDIRHEPAFFGMFQMIAGWPFLADLSTGDHFFGEFRDPYVLFGFWNITGLNLLPILMAIVLFVHQKYMTPPPSATMTPEQIQQQKIMRVMMVTMLPIFLYSAPSGLTLYILTSSCIGIVESRYVRKHVDQMDLEPKKQPAGKKKQKKKPRDPQARAYAEAVDRMKEKKRKKQAPSFKKRR